MTVDLQTWKARVSRWGSRGRLALSRGGERRPVAEPRTAFVLLGGGARGAAQAGALSVLLSNGIVPDFLVGISAGSWNGAYLAQDPTPKRAMELERLWISTTSQDIIGPHRRWIFAVNALSSRASLYGGDGIRRVAARYLQDTTFADLRVPLRILAADLVTGRAKIISEGPLLPAVVASSSMPGIFPPVPLEHEVLVDGGVVEWAGCLAALESGATRICLVGCGGAVPKITKGESFRHVIERSWEIGNRSNFERTVFALRGAGVEVLPVYPTIEGVSLLNFDRAPALIHAGRAAAERALEAWTPVQPEPARRVARRRDHQAAPPTHPLTRGA